MFRAAVAVSLLVAVSAHICVWNPPQRAAFDISQPGADPCYRKPGPCGGIAYNPAGVVTTLKAGTAYTVNFQQNLNHYFVGNPGYLEISFAVGTNPVESAFSPLGQTINDWNAMNMITQTNFSITITVPSTPVPNGVLRARYLSNNPLENDRGEVFHQCSDVTIVAPEAGDVVVPDDAPVVPHTRIMPNAHRVEEQPTTAPAGCCTGARQWTTEWEETGSYRASTNGKTYYDAVNALLRVDAVSGNGNNIYTGSFTMYNNFSSGIEYYLNNESGACEPLGLDYWNDWCYGTVNQTEVFTEQITIGGTTANIWNNGEFFFGGTNDSNCQPVILTRPDKGMMTLYYNWAPGIPDPSVFTPPPQCHLALEEAVRAKRPLRRSPGTARHYGRF